jgi:hypothetical protein
LKVLEPEENKDIIRRFGLEVKVKDAARKESMSPFRSARFQKVYEP